MNIYSIKEQSVALQNIGIAIDTQQRLKLELGLLKLSELANADQLLFWGKIFTTSTPYYIAIGIDFKDHYAFPHKKFYFSKENFNFQELPELDQYNKNQGNNFNASPFSGNPEQILVNIQGEAGSQKIEEQKNQDSEEEDQVKVVAKNLLQVDRLSYTVRSIEIECQIAPVGAYRIIEKHEVRYNQSFRGLNAKQFGLSKFQHFRYPHNPKTISLLESVESVFRFDFLDSVENQSFWATNLNINQTVGTVKSLLWPGYIGYVILNSKAFGGVYFGNGVKQVDLGFLIL